MTVLLISCLYTSVGPTALHLLLHMAVPPRLDLAVFMLREHRTAPQTQEPYTPTIVCSLSIKQSAKQRPQVCIV